MQLTENFNLEEFRSKDGAPFPDDVIENLKELAKNLQVIRDEIGKSVLINSGYRSPSHNKNVGGAKNSTHVLGQAADMRVPGVTPKDVAKTIQRLIDEEKISKGGLKAYNTFTHYDIRGWNARW